MGLYVFFFQGIIVEFGFRGDAGFAFCGTTVISSSLGAKDCLKGHPNPKIQVRSLKNKYKRCTQQQ